MKTFELETKQVKLLADTLTPVNIYLTVRDVYAGSILLESSDYHGNENSLSFICCDPIASFKLLDNRISIQLPDGSKESTDELHSVLDKMEDFVSCFKPDESLQSKYNPSGLFGYTTYDTVRFQEDIAIEKQKDSIPDIHYQLYRYVIVVDHFSNELSIFQHSIAHSTVSSPTDGLDRLHQLISNNRFSTYQFSKEGEEQSNVTDAEFLSIIEKGKSHCFRGDVFQIVLSRRFTTSFKGDEFNVYRALRSINPSPYLFYFDFGSYKLFGSSPEAQIQINANKAFIYPIAGTFKRTGNDQEDLILANKLSKDEKENAEHIMLVDLARNDMSRHAHNVKVEVFKEIQFYSHVIHLVSKVSGLIEPEQSVLKLARDTFPAGTLSGAPKHKAMNLINTYENVNRSFYGGAIGFIGFNRSYNHAIMIRTFLSKNNQLIFQAGAGVVAKSNSENELQEVNNKLGALRKAIELAEKI